MYYQGMKQKLTMLAMLAILSTIMTTAAFAQVDPCYDLTAYCGGDQQCVSDFMPYLYVTCSGDASSMPSWQERYAIASGGMLPPPGGGNPNPADAFQQPCPGPPPLPQPYLTGTVYHAYMLYPYLVSHFGTSCTWWSIEWSNTPR